jgi:branched-chain amino acid transport system substrate-binding protein
MGRPQEVGARLAVQDINSEGGVLGKPVVLKAVHDATAGQATASSDELLRANVDAVIGAPTSGINSFDEQMANSDVGQCLPSRSGPYATASTGSTTFTTAPPDSASTPAIVSELLTQKAKTAAIAAPNTVEGRSVAKAVASQLRSNGVQTSTVTYDPSAASFDSVVHQVLAAKSDDVVELAGAEGPALTGALIDAGVAPAAIVGGPGMLTPSLPRTVHTEQPSKLDNLYVAGPAGDAAFDARVGQTTGNDLLDAAQSYDCAVIIALAAQEAKSTDPGTFASHIRDVTTGANRCSTFALCAALLRQGKSVAYAGHAGPLRLNSRNEPTSAREILGYFDNGYLAQAQYRDYPISGSS